MECLWIATSDICVPLHPQGPVKGQVFRGQTGVPFLDLLVLCAKSERSDILPGRLAPKTLSKKVRKDLRRVDQRHRASQLRKQKKEAVRGLGVRGLVWLHNLSRRVMPRTRKCDPGKGSEMEDNSRARVRCAGPDSSYSFLRFVPTFCPPLWHT